MTTLSRLLARFEDTPAVSEKTAGEATPAAPAVQSTDAAERMLTTVRELAKVASAPPVVTAANPSAIPALDKIAAELAGADEALLNSKFASAGVIFADTVMARFSQYNTEVGSKVAAASPDALQAAYRKGREDLEKEAAVAYEKGQETALAEIHKIASELHYAGQASARNVIEALSQGA